MDNIPKETSSDKIIKTLARFVRTELAEVHSAVNERLDKRDDILDERLNSIDENLCKHMYRTALLEAAREKDAAITQKNNEVIERILPVLTRYEAAETAAKWLYKPAFMAGIAVICWFAGAKGEVILEMIKKIAGF
jgi:hypothetical protein